MDREASEMDDEVHSLDEGHEHYQSSLILTEEENAHVYTPPPHLASRFYRNNRRRSSAASSRRNSISSGHSHSSNRSFRSACQSRTVAQHLRRTSILESRKARLADKAAHAEQVRLRAALAKAVPRVSNSEERAIAAKQAREKFLAKVASACAEEVNHAKKVAEEMKERKAAEERRYRLEIEERHAEAEKRRLEYMRTSRKPRTVSILGGGESKRGTERKAEGTSLEVASKRIQRVWRAWQRHKICREFLGLELTIDRVRSAEFNDASKLLMDRSIISTTRKILRSLGLDVGKNTEETQVRRFLSAYMMLGHPTDVFNKHSQHEEDLISKAKELLISFEAIISEMSASNEWKAMPTQLENLSQSYSGYSTAFMAWKFKDATVLLGTMLDQFVALDDIWQTVKDDTRGEVAEDYREAIRDQQVLLLSKLKKLAGPDRASQLIKGAIRQSRRAQLRRRPQGEVRPRQVEENDANISSTASISTESTSQSRHQQQSQDPSQYVVGRDELSRLFSPIPNNRTLVHELSIDPSYRVQANNDIRSAFNRDLCLKMHQAVSEGSKWSGNDWTMAIAQNIQHKLLKILGPRNSMRNLILEVLDPAHVRSQCVRGCFSYQDFFKFMADLLPRLCAPFRDAEVNQFATAVASSGQSTAEMIEKLSGLLQMIDLMTLDHTNYLISQVAVTLVQQASGYEHRMFAQDLESNRTTLEKVRRWLRQVNGNAGSDFSASSIGTGASFHQIYARGLVDLAAGPDRLQERDLPETLALDLDRFNRIRADLLRFTLVGSTLLTAKNLLKRDVRTQWKPEAKRVLESVREGFDNGDGNLSARILAVVESSKGMPQSSKDHLSGAISRFLSECQAGRLSDPVLKLLMQRLKTHLFNKLAASTSAERVRFASTASESLASIGLSEFLGEIRAISDELGKVSSVDQAAHALWYRQVAEELDIGQAA